MNGTKTDGALAIEQQDPKENVIIKLKFAYYTNYYGVLYSHKSSGEFKD